MPSRIPLSSSWQSWTSLEEAGATLPRFHEGDDPSGASPGWTGPGRLSVLDRSSGRPGRMAMDKRTCSREDTVRRCQVRGKRETLGSERQAPPDERVGPVGSTTRRGVYP
eukprot:scaffold694_cov338-Pavlova_lutheri.AAC.20